MNKSAYILKIAIGMATGAVQRTFGAGGMVAVPSMIHILKVDEHDAHATAIAIILPLLLISSFVYFRRGFLDLNKGIPVAAGGVIGGIAGAFLLHRIPERWLRKVFALFMIAAAVRMII